MAAEHINTPHKPRLKNSHKCWLYAWGFVGVWVWGKDVGEACANDEMLRRCIAISLQVRMLTAISQALEFGMSA